MKRLLTVREVSEILRCSESNVYALKDAGILPFTRVGLKTGFRLAEEDLEEYLAGARTVPAREFKLKLNLKHLQLD